MYPVHHEGDETFFKSFVQFLKIWPVAFLVIAVMGSIVFGIATPTEAAGVGVISSLILGYLWGDLTKSGIISWFYKSAITYV